VANGKVNNPVDHDRPLITSLESTPILTVPFESVDLLCDLARAGGGSIGRGATTRHV
jgi:hypothetical protein